MITEILTKYAQTPKNHMQVLDDRELSLIFEYLTQHNQVSGIQVIFAEGAKAAEKKQEPKKAAPSRTTKHPGAKQAAASQGSQPDPRRQPQQPHQASHRPRAHEPGAPDARWWIPARPPTSIWISTTRSCRTWRERSRGGSRREQQQRQPREVPQQQETPERPTVTNKRKQEEAEPHAPPAA